MDWFDKVYHSITQKLKKRFAFHEIFFIWRKRSFVDVCVYARARACVRACVRGVDVYMRCLDKYERASKKSEALE